MAGRAPQIGRSTTGWTTCRPRIWRATWRKGVIMIGNLFDGMYGYRTAGSYTGQTNQPPASKAAGLAELRRDVKLVAEKMDKLVLLNMAMWSLVQERTGLTEGDLTRRAQEIDLKDGVADGKVTQTVKKCGNCGRIISRRHHRCLYCGSEVLTETPFDGV